MLHEFTMSVIADLYWPYLWFYPETPYLYFLSLNQTGFRKKKQQGLPKVSACDKAPQIFATLAKSMLIAEMLGLPRIQSTIVWSGHWAHVQYTSEVRVP